MSVPSLEDIALYTSIRYIWENSGLQSLTIGLVHTTLETRDWSVSDHVCESKINNTIQPLLEKMMTSKCLPHRLRVRWVIAFEGIYKEFEDWAFEICVRSVNEWQYEDLETVTFCINRIIFTQAGFIDKTKTILEILKDSQFCIKFDPELLVRNVEEKTLHNLEKQVLGEMVERGAKMPRMERDTDRIIASMESYKYTVSLWRRNIDERERSCHCSAGKLAHLAERGELSAARQYIDQQRELSPDSLQEQIKQAALSNITVYSSNLEMIMFLLDNMDRCHLIEVLNEHFEYIFRLFLKSWRYRSLCLRFFRDVAQTMNPETFEYMFYDARLAWEDMKYAYYDIMPILQSVWFDAPDRLKQNELFISNTIPGMSIIDTEFMRKHLLQHWPSGGKNFMDHLKLLESIYNGNIDAFKREVLKDKDFMNKFLEEFWFGNMDEFLSWCHNEDATSVKKYISQLLDEGLIQNVYENVFNADEISEADLGLETLQLSDKQIKLLKKNIMNRPKLKKAMVDSILNHHNLRIDVIKSEFSFYFNEKQEQESMERLFLCEEARDAILALLLPPRTRFEEDRRLLCTVSEFLIEFLYKIEVLFEPYSLQDRIDEMLHEYGHPNLRTENIYGIYGFNAREMAIARKLVDCNYRSVRAMLRRDFTKIELCEVELNDVTAFSLEMAAQAALDIPVVL